MVRALCAAVLLIMLWGIYSAWSSAFEGNELPASMVKWFAVSAFGGITIGWEVLVAWVIADERKRKTLDYLWRPRRLGAVLGLLVLAGVGLESLHPLSLPALVLALLVYGWFAAAIGVWGSIHLRSTWRAQFLTIAGLPLVNVLGQGILKLLTPHGFAPQLWPGFTSYEVGKLIMSPDIVHRLSRTNWPRFWGIWDLDDGLGWLTIFSILSLSVYTGLGLFLTWDVLRRLEIAAGRASVRESGA